MVVSSVQVCIAWQHIFKYWLGHFMSNSIKNISKIFIVIITLGALNILSSNAAETISPRVPAKRLVPYSPESISEGKKLFTLHCKACHGTDGKSKIDFKIELQIFDNETRHLIKQM